MDNEVRSESRESTTLKTLELLPDVSDVDFELCEKFI